MINKEIKEKIINLYKSGKSLKILSSILSGDVYSPIADRCGHQSFKLGGLVQFQMGEQNINGSTAQMVDGHWSVKPAL